MSSVVIPPSDVLEKLQGKAILVSDILELFNARRRTYETVPAIQNAFGDVGLTTVPAFATAGLADEVTVVPAVQGQAPDEQPEAEDDDAAPKHAMAVGSLPCATGGLTSVGPGTSLSTAITMMMTDNLPQLPVIQGQNELRGVVTWTAITALHARGAVGTTVEDVFDSGEVPEVNLSDKLLPILPKLRKHGYVLVRDHSGVLCGMVTSADITDRVGAFAEPFFTVGEIERSLRACITSRFTTAEVKASGVNARSVAEMTLGNYHRLLLNEQNWQKLNWHAVDQHYFLARLDGVRVIRNDIMHFDAAPLTSAKLEKLQSFAGLMRNLHPA